MRAAGSRPVATAAALGLVIGLAGVGAADGDRDDAAAAGRDGAAAGRAGAAEASVADYLRELERAGLIDVDTGSRDTLARELGAAEALLNAGASLDAAVALYAIVESPRYEAFSDFVEYQNAEYDLAVSLATAGAYDSAIAYLARVLARGPGSMYFAPAHRRAVDIALETRDFAGVLAMLDGVKLSEPLPVEASGERTYLRGRAAYAAGDLATAEAELPKLGRKSRLFSSALYLRGVIRARRGELRGAAEALCEVVETPDDNEYALVIDDRYFTIKDLARLGLGRIAHEQAEYDDAYYHYFQIPDDSERLPEALFEAAWSMYQKRDLDAARDLLDEMLAAFPRSPLAPEARLLAGYVELADCKFDAAQTAYDGLAAELQPIVDELDAIRKDPERRRALFDRAIAGLEAGGRGGAGGRRADAAGGVAGDKDAPITDKVLALLRIDPSFVRLHQSVRGLTRASADAPHVVSAWAGLGRRVSRDKVGAVAAAASAEQEEAATAHALVQDVRRLRQEVARAQTELRRGVREQTIAPDAARAEKERLDALGRQVDALEARAARAAQAVDAPAAGGRPQAASLAAMVRRDLAAARALERSSARLAARLAGAADELSERTIERLYRDIRRVLDKAKLGKIDAVIGQKRRLDIEVQDLASGRYPAELTGRLWEEGLIGDDEEYWPFEGEYWADEYEGYR